MAADTTTGVGRAENVLQVARCGSSRIGLVPREAVTPPVEQFRRGCDFAARRGLVPHQYSIGGKRKPGKTSRIGQREKRRLWITGAPLGSVLRNRLPGGGQWNAHDHMFRRAEISCRPSGIHKGTFDPSNVRSETKPVFW